MAKNVARNARPYGGGYPPPGPLPGLQSPPLPSRPSRPSRSLSRSLSRSREKSSALPEGPARGEAISPSCAARRVEWKHRMVTTEGEGAKAAMSSEALCVAAKCGVRACAGAVKCGGEGEKRVPVYTHRP